MRDFRELNQQVNEVLNSFIQKLTTQVELFLSWKGSMVLGAKERGRNNFPNYASQLQAIFARSQITKISK